MNKIRMDSYSSDSDCAIVEELPPPKKSKQETDKTSNSHTSHNNSPKRNQSTNYSKASSTSLSATKIRNCEDASDSDCDIIMEKNSDVMLLDSDDEPSATETTKGQSSVSSPALPAGSSRSFSMQTPTASTSYSVVAKLKEEVRSQPEFSAKGNFNGDANIKAGMEFRNVARKSSSTVKCSVNPQRRTVHFMSTGAPTKIPPRTPQSSQESEKSRNRTRNRRRKSGFNSGSDSDSNSTGGSSNSSTPSTSDSETDPSDSENSTKTKIQAVVENKSSENKNCSTSKTTEILNNSSEIEPDSDGLVIALDSDPTVSAVPAPLVPVETEAEIRKRRKMKSKTPYTLRRDNEIEIIDILDDDEQDGNYRNLLHHQMICEVCDKLFKQKLKFISHHRRHYSRDHFQCPTCLRGFTSLTLCIDHEVRVHHKKKIPVNHQQQDKNKEATLDKEAENNKAPLLGSMEVPVQAGPSVTFDPQCSTVVSVAVSTVLINGNENLNSTDTKEAESKPQVEGQARCKGQSSSWSDPHSSDSESNPAANNKNNKIAPKKKRIVPSTMLTRYRGPPISHMTDCVAIEEKYGLRNRTLGLGKLQIQIQAIQDNVFDEDQEYWDI